MPISPRAQKISANAVDFINKNLLPSGTTATLKKISSQTNVYKIDLEIDGNGTIVYVSKDGKLLFLGGYDLTETAIPENGQESQTPPPTSVKPDVKLFVMSYCPFGLQAEKAYLPVYELLKDRADLGIYFINYAMHGKQEIDENLKQYCIQKEQNSKFSQYLSCFVKSGVSASCLTTAQIDQQKMNSCVSKTDNEFNITSLYNDQSSWVNGQYPQFNIHKALNDQYGVQGSPTLIINGVEITLKQRSPEALKSIVCQAFETKPAECDQKLSETVVGSGFGEGTGNSSGGACE
ncbi:MAG: hypothetical protein Q8N56_02250, partial [bacterium]|nr:hypothetical protein [bacterium]